MAGRVQWEAQVDSNIKQLLGDAKQLRDELDGIKKGKYEVKLNIDEKKLENVISNLDKMLTSLGKGAGDFKEFENLSNQLKDIVSEVQLLNKAFGGINDKGASNLLSAINNIDKSLSSLNEHIIAVNKDFGNVGKNVGNNVDQINEARKATEGLADATKDLKNAQKNIDSTLSKSYKTKNKTEAYNQLKQASDVFKNIYGNEEIMSSKAGAEAAYAYYKSYEEALKKGIAKSKLEKATVDVDDDFFNAERISSIRIDDFSNFKKYGGDLTDLSLEISKFEEKLLKFNDAYSKVYNALGNAPITPEIIKNIEEYVRNLEIAESRTRDKNLLGFTDEDIDIYKNASDMYLDFALEDAVAENKKYISSLEEIQRNAEKIKNSIKDINADKLNISSGLTDTIQDDTDKSNMESVASATEEAVQAKKDFATANEGVQSSVDGSKSQLELEAELMSNIAKSAREAADAKKEFVEANKDVSNSSIDKSDISSSIRNTSQSDKIEQANTFAKELDQTLEQVDIPADSFNEVLSKLDLAKSELGEIIKITKQSVSDSEGKFHDSYTLKDRRGSTEIYGLNSETEKGQLLRSNIVGYDVKEIEQKTKAQQQLTEAMAKGREQAEKSRQAEEKRQQLAQNNAINKALEQEYKERQKNIQEAEKQVELDKQKALEFTKSASEKLSSAISKYSYGDLSDATSMMKQMNRGLSNFGDLSNIQNDISKLSSIVDNIISDLKLSHEQSLSALNQEIKSEQQLQSQKDAFHKRNINAIDLEIQKREEESKMFSSTLKAQMEERQSQISSMESSLSSFKEKSSVLSLKPDDEHRFPKYTEYINKLNSAISEYETLTTSLKTKDIIDEDDINRAKELEKNITNLFKEVKKFSGGEKGYENISATKVAAQINKLLEDNTRMSKEAKEQIKAYYAEVASGKPTRPLKEIYNDALKVVQAEKEMGRGGKSFLSAIKEKMWYGAAGQIANMFGFYDIINYARQGIDTVRELDTAFTEMRKVSDETVNSLKNYQATTFDTADAVGTTAKQIQDSTADWLRLGESMNQAAESAKVSNVLLNVSEFDSIDSATESLVAMSQAYQDLSKMDIVDVLNNIGKILPKHMVTYGDVKSW